jgi:hypothetical protein
MSTSVVNKKSLSFTKGRKPAKHLRTCEAVISLKLAGIRIIHKRHLGNLEKAIFHGSVILFIEAVD